MDEPSSSDGVEVEGRVTPELAEREHYLQKLSAEQALALLRIEALEDVKDELRSRFIKEAKWYLALLSVVGFLFSVAGILGLRATIRDIAEKQVKAAAENHVRVTAESYVKAVAEDQVPESIETHISSQAESITESLSSNLHKDMEKLGQDLRRDIELARNTFNGALEKETDEAKAELDDAIGGFSTYLGQLKEEVRLTQENFKNSKSDSGNPNINALAQEGQYTIVQGSKFGMVEGRIKARLQCWSAGERIHARLGTIPGPRSPNYEEDFDVDAESINQWKEDYIRFRRPDFSCEGPGEVRISAQVLTREEESSGWSTYQIVP